MIAVRVVSYWGTSWMMQVGDLPTGGYFWRPPYINHGAFASKNGIIAIGRTDAHLHNYFHHNPWTTLKRMLTECSPDFEAYETVAIQVGGSQMVTTTSLILRICITTSRPRSRLRVGTSNKSPGHSKDLKYWK